MMINPPADYVLVWQDTFDEQSYPSEERWQYDTARNKSGWYNNEVQYYARRRSANTRIENGKLIIQAQREDLSRERLRDWKGQRFSSARLTTRGKARWHRGFFEIRAKLPCAVGAWPAIWLFPDKSPGNWEGGEIDIAEAVGHEPDVVYHAVHTPEQNFKNGNHQQARTTIRSCDAFHDYQLHWTADSVTIAVDGKVALVTDAAAFDRPMSLIFNVAVGGDWGGAEGIDEAAFPASMEVEHVRVWQRS
ncbi:family 16 glycosylhydrolase [Altererythrobacter soli]|uniref:Family 16 glycosylhydrolase n=1 Tax=Croceibacterium soli TaxID=1739690 RepID=A0A6I4UWD9_9SPHN|nr:glycoside hydrolase family 16 protein [Croceibacterium soli]MXP42079.1 family 16 glycosylhydrolase [Croceibacterium soli]